MKTLSPEAKRRRLHRQLAELVTWLETDEDRPVVFGSDNEYEWLLRLTGVVVSLLARHRVDSQGRCQWCDQRRRGWRRLLPRWNSRTVCQVLSTTWSFAASEPALVWWQTFNLTGEKISLEAVREWLSTAGQSEDEPDPEPQHTASEGRSPDDDLLAGLWATTVQPAQPVRPYVDCAMPTVQFNRPPPELSDAETEQLPKIHEV
jgi:hypothetical protein